MAVLVWTAIRTDQTISLIDNRRRERLSFTNPATKSIFWPGTTMTPGNTPHPGGTGMRRTIVIRSTGIVMSARENSSAKLSEIGSGIEIETGTVTGTVNENVNENVIETVIETATATVTATETVTETVNGREQTTKLEDITTNVVNLEVGRAVPNIRGFAKDSALRPVWSPLGGWRRQWGEVREVQMKDQTRKRARIASIGALDTTAWTTSLVQTTWPHDQIAM